MNAPRAEPLRPWRYGIGEELRDTRREPFRAKSVSSTVTHDANELTPADDEDVRLMRRACEGDGDAFSLLCTRHRPRLRAFLYRLFGDREKAEDGAQEVLLRLWLARRRYEPRSRFTTFLYQIALNHWRDECRKARARPREQEAEPQAPSSRLQVRNTWSLEPGAWSRGAATSQPEHELFVRYRQWRIRQAIARLPEHYRLVFVLAHQGTHPRHGSEGVGEGRRLAEIAAILDVPLGTVKSRMHAAVRLLRGWLTEEESEDV
jgi:RNA polymerase sigma-70 factor (ECF subfamily)